MQARAAAPAVTSTRSTRSCAPSRGPSRGLGRLWSAHLAPRESDQVGRTRCSALSRPSSSEDHREALSAPRSRLLALSLPVSFASIPTLDTCQAPRLPASRAPPVLIASSGRLTPTRATSSRTRRSHPLSRSSTHRRSRQATSTHDCPSLPCAARRPHARPRPRRCRALHRPPRARGSSSCARGRQPQTRRRCRRRRRGLFRNRTDALHRASRPGRRRAGEQTRGREQGPRATTGAARPCPPRTDTEPRRQSRGKGPRGQERQRCGRAPFPRQPPGARLIRPLSRSAPTAAKTRRSVPLVANNPKAPRPVSASSTTTSSGRVFATASGGPVKVPVTVPPAVGNPKHAFVPSPAIKVVSYTLTAPGGRTTVYEAQGPLPTHPGEPKSASSLPRPALSGAVTDTLLVRAAVTRS